MKKIIHHLRSKTEQERRDILYIATVIFAFILISLWIYTLGINFSNPDTQSKMEDDLKPFSVIKDSIVDSYQNGKANLGTQDNQQ